MEASERADDVGRMHRQALEMALEIVERASPPPYDRPDDDAERRENAIVRAANIQAAATLAVSIVRYGIH